MNLSSGYMPRLNFTRFLIVLGIAFGFASTMPMGPDSAELGYHLGYEPSWIGVQLLFFFSGYLALASLERHKSAVKYLTSKALRNGPLLIAFTLAAVLVIYPLFGVKSDNSGAVAKKLLRYVFDTVSCTNPGRPLPGLLDDAKYMCLIQGAVWTFRWGVIAHSAAAIGWKFGLFTKRTALLIFAALATLAYMIVKYLATQTGLSLEIPFTGLRLAYPFLIGMTVWAYRDKLPTDTLSHILFLCVSFAVAFVNYMVFPPTPLIEISLISFWGYAALLLSRSETPLFKWTEDWPHLALGLYLSSWPVAQILLLKYPETGSWVLVLMTLPIACLIAFIANLAISRPLLTRARNSRGEIPA